MTRRSVECGDDCGITVASERVFGVDENVILELFVSDESRARRLFGWWDSRWSF